jgi:predicted nucleotidyltransferase
MTPSPTSTIAWLRTVAKQLGNLRSEVVFLGGATMELFITDPGAGAPRPTKDVDVIVELGSYAEYVHLQERLRERGFQEDSSEGAPLCRWVTQGIKVDVMPTREEILGFTNCWYAAAMRDATEVDLGHDVTIRLVSAPCFVATKLEAFRARGDDDYMLSHDLEDVVAVVDGRAELSDEIRSSAPDLRDYLAEAISALLNVEEFREALPGYLPGDTASQARLPLLLDRLAQIADRES